MTHLLALGCSHTAGTGVNPDQCYVKLTADRLGMNLINLAVPGGNHFTVQQNLTQHLNTQRPAQIILQWPNLFRITTWSGANSKLENISHHGSVFQAMLAAGNNNFVEPWIQSIVVCNLLCQSMNLPVVNILLEDVDQYIHVKLNHFSIKLHQDDKLPGATWFFDSAGSDGIHHSAQCHEKWAQRILTIINEPT